MKIQLLSLAALTLCFATAASAETVHQKANGDKAFASAGVSALDKKLVEVKDEAKADDGKITRIVGSTPQWGFVSYWFGIAAPAGKSTIRFHIYVDADPIADFGVYRLSPSGQEFLAKLKIPADAKPNTYVTVDVPVDAKEDWSGVALKKMVASDKPGPWIDTVSVVLP